MARPAPLPYIAAMSLLTIDDVTIRMAGRVLLDHAGLSLDAGRKVGLVGRNGAGKSTLLRAIAGELAVDGGAIRLAPRARLGWVRQEAPDGDADLIETVLAADAERSALLAEADAADPRPAGGGPRPAARDRRRRGAGAGGGDPRRPGLRHGGAGAAPSARSPAAGGCASRSPPCCSPPRSCCCSTSRPTTSTWKPRCGSKAGSRGILARPLIVSHDRGLLDRAVDAIAHLDKTRLSLTPGNFETFVRIRSEQAMHQARAVERIAAQRAHMQAYVDRFRYKASKARQAQSRLKALERLPPAEAMIEDAPTRFAFPEPARLAPPILALDRVSVGYGGAPVLRSLSLTVDMEDRIALLGANGNGKSTLAKLIAGRLEPSSGEVRRSPRLRVGYFAQHQTDELVLAESSVAHMARALPRAPPPQVRAQLARFGLDADRADTPVENLSGGEKARLLLALATRDAPQLLILDEPTNHLDIDARDALVRALADFQGAVLLITHDPHLVELVADRLWLVGDGTVKPYDGDLDDYRALLVERSRPAAKAEAPTRRDDRRERAEARVVTAPLRRRAKDAEALIAKLAQERAKLEGKLADPSLYAPGRAAEVTAANTRLAAIGREVAAAEAEWMQAEEALEGGELTLRPQCAPAAGAFPLAVLGENRNVSGTMQNAAIAQYANTSM